jgi:hypothetical protein
MEITVDSTDYYCLVCGGKLNKRPNKNKYRCISCGEVYDLEEFETFEIEIPVFDKLLLHSLKKKSRPTRYRDQTTNYI